MVLPVKCVPDMIFRLDKVLDKGNTVLALFVFTRQKSAGIAYWVTQVYICLTTVETSVSGEQTNSLLGLILSQYRVSKLDDNSLLNVCLDVPDFLDAFLAFFTILLVFLTNY